MKRLLTAALAAFFMLTILCATAYAAPPDEPFDEPTDEQIDETAFESEIPLDLLGALLGGMNAATEETATPNPFTPSGTGTVVDNATDTDGKEFYTITAADETVFYLIIDRQRDTENVYFLNAVTLDDLVPLAVPPKGQTTAPAQPTSPTEPTPTETPPFTEPQQPSGNNTTMLIAVAVVAVLGGGAAWYFKVYKPKQSGGTSEYEPPAEEDIDDWNDEDGDDTPPWDDDSGESEDTAE